MAIKTKGPTETEIRGATETEIAGPPEDLKRKTWKGKIAVRDGQTLKKECALQLGALLHGTRSLRLRLRLLP